MDNYIGKKLEGRYEIRELIGVGGMANVYKGFDVLENKVVAVKILREEFASNEEFVKRFKLESKAISMLTHPNIVRVYDVTFTDRIQSIVMEYVDGITLKEYIDQQKVLKWKEAVHFTVQILRALQHAHDKGIIHRDIKPQNIMLQRDGTIKVMDFGIARFNHSEPITSTDKVIGSVYYISPEQARGDMTDERTDVYSVGVMLFEMLTGSLPFDAADPVSVAMKQISDKPKQPRDLNPTIPEALEDITLRAMQKDVALRYQSAAEMLRDIEAFKENPHIQFEYKYLEESPTKYMEAINKNRQMTAVTDSASAVAAEEKPAKKSAPVVLILAGVASVLLVAVLVWAYFFFSSITKNSDFEVPDVLGMTVAEVNIKYPKMQLDEKTAYSSEYPAGQIMEQSKKPGRMMNTSDTMEVTVSKGPKTGTIPEVYQLPLDEAKSRLEVAGFTNYVVQANKENDPKLDDGLVTGTDPAIGAKVDVEKEIIIYINPSAKPISVRNVVGMTSDEATTLLKDDFNVKIVTMDSDQPKGIVLKQSDVSALKYATITLTVSTGKGAAKTVNVTVDLTQLHLDSEVTLKSYYDGDALSQKVCIPTAAGSWVIPIQGTGTHTLQIRLNGAGHTNYLYASFTVNLDTGLITASQYHSVTTQPSTTTTTSGVPEEESSTRHS